MSEKSEFQIAFDNFQKDITTSLFELASCSDYFKECSTFPLAGPPPLIESAGKARIRKTKKESNEDESNKDEKASKAEKTEKVEKTQKTQKKDKKEDTKEKPEKEWTIEEIDKEIIASSKRTHADLRSSNFMKNLKKRIKNIENSVIKERIEHLLNKGAIINNPQA